MGLNFFSGYFPILFNRMSFIEVLKRGIFTSYIVGTGLSPNAKFPSKDNESGRVLMIPEPPTNCCMSACPNCVWIQYAEDLTELFKDGGEKSREIILKKVTDPNMQAFLLLELRTLEKRNK